MKKILISRLPLLISIISLLVFSVFLRVNLYLNSVHLINEFKTQNAKELYAIDTLKISSRLNSFSSAINWVCVEGSAGNRSFFKMNKEDCHSGLFQQQVELKIPEANDLKLSLTLKLGSDIQLFFISFLIMQIALIFSLILATKIAEKESRLREIEYHKMALQTSHDIRSPLALLNSYLQNSSTDSDENSQLIEKSIIRINEIANSLLSNSKQVSVINLPKYQSIKNLINEVVDEKKTLFPLLFISDSNLEDTNVLVNDGEFKRIISNLLNNSIESAKVNPIIEISGKFKKNTFELYITDNGNGIPDEILSNFGVKNLTTKKNGNGLGITHALNLLKEWGGNLEVVQSKNTGTTLRLTLKKQILETCTHILLDDDELTRINWEYKARKKNLDLITFKNADDFKNSLENMDKDAVIYIDSELGSTKGEDLALELHQLGFTNLNITSGHSSDKFSHLPFLKSVIDKNPPF